MMLKTLLCLCVLTYAAAKSDLDCNFDADFCKWANDPNNWLVNWGISVVGEMESGMQREVCLAPPRRSKRLIIPESKLLTARLWSPVVYSYKKLSCVSFSYKLEEVEDMKLTLMRREMGSCKSMVNKETGAPILFCDIQNLWLSNGSDLDKSGWNKVHISMIQGQASDFKLILEGTIPSGNPNAKICVDNITSSAEPCQIPTPVPIFTPSSHSWIAMFGMTFAGVIALGLIPLIGIFIGCLLKRKHYVKKLCDDKIDSDRTNPPINSNRFVQEVKQTLNTNSPTDENSTIHMLYVFPPGYEEVVLFNTGQGEIPNEKPLILPPQIPHHIGRANTSSSIHCRPSLAISRLGPS